MDQVDSITNESNVTREVEAEVAAGTEDFELKVLDCGTNYQMESASSTCLSCFCGSGCFCGSA